ncbi:MAG: excinuclease ABC subunit UvrC [Deltaproteobacteria bacterium]|jgi:excinuclease ABC subunit C|nr:excinuclease ABC subunit UvrC [Deltaproteobacteria bacterium]
MTWSPVTEPEPGGGPASTEPELAGQDEARLARLRRLAQELPPAPGVYLMADQKGQIIYVGKAKVLPRRVSGYFQRSGQTPRVTLMVSQVASFEFVVTNTEKEALILENSLIKKHRPRFNVILRDDKTYPSLRLNHHDPFPSLEIVRRPVKDGSIIYGPFPSAGALRETARLVTRLFPLRKCRRPEVKKTSRPCLNYQMGRCVGPCRPEMTEAEYRVVVERVRLFFRGRGEEVIADLTASMGEAAQRLDYERAARIRDQIRDLRTTLERQVVARVGSGDRDFWGLASRGGVAQAAVLTVREGVVTGCRPAWAEGQDSPGPILLSLITQYYGQGHFIPPEICLPPADLRAEEGVALAEWLTSLGQAVEVGFGSGEDDERVLALAAENARVSLEERLEKMVRAQGSLVELKARLDLAVIPRRLECFDLAHIQGQATTAGMVVMEEGELKKEAYRRFKIKAEVKGDDYAGLQEALKRRFDPAKDPQKWPWPDLLLLDGGRGQLSAALKAFAELGLEPPPLAAIAKDRTGQGPDRIFKPNRKNPVDLRAGSAGLLLLARLRDEAHRYCRSYHHLLRSKEMVESLFDGLKGLGPARRQALLGRFVSLEELAQAADAEILAVTPLAPATLAELRSRVQKLLSGTLPETSQSEESLGVNQFPANPAPAAQGQEST